MVEIRYDLTDVLTSGLYDFFFFPELLKYSLFYKGRVIYLKGMLHLIANIVTSMTGSEIFLVLRKVKKTFNMLLKGA